MVPHKRDLARHHGRQILQLDERRQHRRRCEEGFGRRQVRVRHVREVHDAEEEEAELLVAQLDPIALTSRTNAARGITGAQHLSEADEPIGA